MAIPLVDVVARRVFDRMIISLSKWSVLDFVCDASDGVEVNSVDDDVALWCEACEGRIMRWIFLCLISPLSHRIEDRGSLAIITVR